jgi:hypothetical protein
VSEGTRYGLAKRRQMAMVMPMDLAYLRDSSTVAKPLLPFFQAAQIEGTELALAYEGEAGTPSHRPLSAPRKALLDDYLRAGLFMRGELARYAQSQDADAGSRAITAMGRRSAILEKLGLDHIEREITLDEYLSAKAAENRAGDPNGGGSDPAIETDEDAANRGTEGGAAQHPCGAELTSPSDPGYGGC